MPSFRNELTRFTVRGRYRNKPQKNNRISPERAIRPISRQARPHNPKIMMINNAWMGESRCESKGER